VAIKNEQSRETGNVVYTEHRPKARVSYKKLELLTFRGHLGPPRDSWRDPCGPSFLGFCVVYFVLFAFGLCSVYTTLPVSLDCSFLIATSIFSNVY
jgi:hypothetical protein